MSTVSVTLPSDGQTIDAADYNVPINTIVSELNGNLNSQNIASSGVVPNNLFTGTGTSWAWQTWTPTWTNLTVGSGTVTARSVQIGKTVFAYVRFVFGAGSAVGTNPTFSLPVAAPATTATIVGQCYVEDAGLNSYVGQTILASTTTALPQIVGTGGTYGQPATITATAPFTWAAGDYFVTQLIYEAA